ncbi:hypothetical protein [Breznakia sp. PM6-1]|uniref:hypothetical protein n=1 Tax=Breznakia sp. PM6-1 TaxID=2940628 RepID=UPI002404A717|nr:hypothetical protein [Breznakia sp. PM6-1]MDF9824459.1 hypothetical protein [Breznakia sp. PM6-1]
MKYAGKGLVCLEINQELIDDYILHHKEKVSDESVNSYQFKISPVIHYGYDRGSIRDEITKLGEDKRGLYRL